MSYREIPEESLASENPLWPILVETVHRLPMYPSHKAWVRDRMLPEDPDLSVKSLSFRLDISLGEAMVILHELGEK